ncbi:MAG: hypothetical protein WCQ32_02695 [bacterium]
MKVNISLQNSVFLVLFEKMKYMSTTKLSKETQEVIDVINNPEISDAAARKKIEAVTDIPQNEKDLIFNCLLEKRESLFKSWQLEVATSYMLGS